MDMQVTVFLLIWGITGLQCVAAAEGSEFYTAAVVEYAPFEMQPEALDNPSLTMRKNVLNYIYFMEQAARKEADIIVFPECGITGIHLPSSREELRPYLTEIPDPRSQPNPCLDATGNRSAELLKELSCASRMYRIYSVINLPETASCATQDGVATSACPEDGVFIYNTNIVFDRNGTVVARYRKYNLYMEPGFNTEPTAGHSIFDTDFGVRFGMFICFDILFRQPAVAIVTAHNITDVVYSTAWFSELPFLTAVQIQAAWSYATDTNFLASGYSNPSNSNTGSGIFGGRDGVLTSVMAFDKPSRLLVAKVNKKRKIRGREEDNDRGYGTRTKRHDGSLVKIAEISKDGNQLPRVVSSIQNDGIQNSHKYEQHNEIKNINKRSVIEPESRETFKSELHLFNTALLDLTKVDDEGNNKQSLFLCHLSLCCNFTLNTTPVREIQTNMVDKEFYRVGVYDGNKQSGYQTCLVMRCVGPDIESCREDIDNSKFRTPSTVFKEIKIDGIFIKSGMRYFGNRYCVISEPGGDFGTNKQRTITCICREIPNLSIFSLYIKSFYESEDLLLPYGHLKIYQEDISHYNTSLIGSQNINKQLNLCHGSLCCQFYIGAEIEINSTFEEVQKVKNSQLNSNNGYYFRIGVFEGVRSFGVVTIEAGLQVCAIFACTSQNITSCGLLKNQTRHIENEEILPGTTETISNASLVDDADNNNGIGSLNEGIVLKRLEIKGYFEKDNLIMPNTLTTNLLPFKGLDFEFSSESEQRSDIHGMSKTLVTMKTNGKALDDMLTFGIYARDFQKDKSR